MSDAHNRTDIEADPDNYADQIQGEEDRLSNLFIDYTWIYSYRQESIPRNKSKTSIEDITLKALKRSGRVERSLSGRSLPAESSWVCKRSWGLKLNVATTTYSRRAAGLWNSSICECKFRRDMAIPPFHEMGGNGDIKFRHAVTSAWITENPFIERKEYITECILRGELIEPKDLEGGRILRDMDPGYFFKQNVLRCDIVCLSLALNMDFCGLGLTNTYNGIFFTAHLYNPGKQLKWISRSWSELDRAIRVHKNALFEREAPQTPRNIHGCFLRRTGVSTTAWARD